MSKTALTVIIIVVVVLGLGYAWYTMYPESFPLMNQPTDTATPSSELPSGEENSDEALAQDLAELDAQLDALNEETASADASIEESAQPQ